MAEFLYRVVYSISVSLLTRFRLKPRSSINSFILILTISPSNCVYARLYYPLLFFLKSIFLTLTPIFMHQRLPILRLTDRPTHQAFPALGGSLKVDVETLL